MNVAAVRIAPRAARASRDTARTALSLGIVTTFLTLIVVLPIAALVWQSTKGGSHGFWHAVTAPEALSALELTLGASVVVAVLNAVLGTITAWVLVRDDFPGKTVVNAIID